MTARRLAGIAGAVLGVAMAAAEAVAPAAAQEPYYHKPMPAVVDILEAPPLPNVWLSPARDQLLIAAKDGYPPLSDLAAPMVRLAGVRINPLTNGPQRAPYWIGLTLKSLADGKERRVALPESVRVSSPDWSADGKYLAFTNAAKDSVELWILDVAGGTARRIHGVHLNPTLGAGLAWMPDQKTLLVKVVPRDRGAPPPAPSVPPGPDMQEASGKHGIGSTYERKDVLENAHDEDLFDYYGTSSLAFVDVATGAVSRFAKPDLYAAVMPSPDGAHFIVERIHHPYSHLHPYWRFPREVEIWDRSGNVEKPIASLPLADQVPIDGVPTGPRGYHWQPTAPATLVYEEALDGGDPSAKVPFRDRMLRWAAPFSGKPTEALRLKERFDGIAWTDSSAIALVDEYDRDRRWTTTYAADLSAPDSKPRVMWDLSENERYRDPGTPLFRPLPNGFNVVDRDGEWIYLSGAGSTPTGDRPFLDRFSLRTLRAERLFRSDRVGYESFAGWLGLGPGRSRFLTRRESPQDPPNFYVRTIGKREAAPAPATPATPGAGEAQWASAPRAVTRFLDPTPQLRGITKRIVTYKRADGTPLSFTLYLPPGYKTGTRLPTVLWAYPLEYSDAGTAGQVSGSERRFVTINGASPLFFLFDGYAVLDNVGMPVIGHPDSVYNTYLDQIVANAKAAIDKAVELGVTDRDRVGVGGHSHGAFMTANLLAHSDLFRAGIARSGAYNHTMRPFGFQSEHRTYFEAPESYIRLSPMLHADQIHEPLLLIHGEEDANPGTVPLQSDLLYRAVVGTGGTARLVMLPLESHNYEAKESIEHVLWEMMDWFARYVKDAPARAAAPGSGSAATQTRGAAP
ncbi:MAG TPA: prolyl oligopeptidase family serine peptidase [Candidatus Limnocylindrales bacterium]|nr:prolyl oligopeptidase family serine peptidase [Candidatus Limnocylindrales bacterium]